VQLGWEIVKIDQFEVRSAVQRVATRRTLRQRDVLLRMLVLGHLSGAPGSAANVVFENGAGQQVTRKIVRDQPQGTQARFGFLPPMIVDFETRRPRPNTGYVRFNVFLDPAGLMAKFEDSVKSCLKCDGFIVDLRGNPEAWRSSAQAWRILHQSAGHQARDSLSAGSESEAFRESPAGELSGAFSGAGGRASVSTSEIMAGGLQDLKRARVFGTPTAGAALPSMVERLPNGDLFQYAMANYISEGGRVLEGVGVVPDQPVVTTQSILLKGKDPVLEAALDWIHAQKR
jgi:carboxyl-terminal processing protease